MILQNGKNMLIIETTKCILWNLTKFFVTIRVCLKENGEKFEKNNAVGILKHLPQNSTTSQNSYNIYQI